MNITLEDNLNDFQKENLLVMKNQEELPACKEVELIMDQLVELTSEGCGCLPVIDNEHHFIGPFADGDLRRTLKASREGIFKLTIGKLCNRNPRTIDPEAMATEAMQKMESSPSRHHLYNFFQINAHYMDWFQQGCELSSKFHPVILLPLNIIHSLQYSNLDPQMNERDLCFCDTWVPKEICNAYAVCS